MAEPPALPNFDFDDVTASEDRTVIPPPRNTRPPAPPQDLPDGIVAVAPMDDAATPMGPGSPTEPLPSYRTKSGPVPGVAGPAIHETVDEVLHHTSEQTLRLVHLEDRFREIGANLEDLREEMHAGFGETRQLVEQARQAMFRVESQHASQAVASPERLTSRLDTIEEQSTKANKRQQLLVGLVAAQALLLVIAVAFIVLVRQELKSEARLRASELEHKPASTAATTLPPGPVPTFGSVPAIATPALLPPPDPLADRKAKLRAKKKR